MQDTVRTVYGEVKGTQRDGVRLFAGIPFAAPPVGERLFRHPVPPEPWEGVLDASRGRENPVQSKGRHGVSNSSLDCLYLNVFVPEEAEMPLPVMVWFYGGSYKEGGTGAAEKGSEELALDASRFARETGCVTVTFNYRVNLSGFLYLHGLDPSFDSNNGLYDQILALRFIRENISAFGGDPGSVTLFGQSAGSACILALMQMDEAAGLFDKVIIQSACAEHFFTPEEGIRYAKRYLRFAKVRTPEKLSQLSIEAVEEANRKFASSFRKRGDSRCAFSPVVDGETLKERPAEAAIRGTIPMLIGNVAEEARLFTDWIPDRALRVAAWYFHMKPRKEGASYRERVMKGLMDELYLDPLRRIADAYSGSVWRYEYRYVMPGSQNGCCHASELPVLFDDYGSWKCADDPETQRVGRNLRQIWGAFAKTGDPGWEEYAAGRTPHVIE